MGQLLDLTAIARSKNGKFFPLQIFFQNFLWEKICRKCPFFLLQVHSEFELVLWFSIFSTVQIFVPTKENFCIHACFPLGEKMMRKTQ